MNSLLITICGCGGGKTGPNGVYELLETTFKEFKINMDVIMVETYPNSFDYNVNLLMDVVENNLDKYQDIYLCGWSMGAAVSIETTYQINNKFHNMPIKGIISLATQGAGTKNITKLNVPILFIHGKDDLCIPPFVSEVLCERYQNAKKLILLKKTNHGFCSYTTKEMATIIVSGCRDLFKFD